MYFGAANFNRSNMQFSAKFSVEFEMALGV